MQYKDGDPIIYRLIGRDGSNCEIDGPTLLMFALNQIRKGNGNKSLFINLSPLPLYLRDMLFISSCVRDAVDQDSVIVDISGFAAFLYASPQAQRYSEESHKAYEEAIQDFIDMFYE